ncbi:hypothetical protein Psi01_44770 [Planobispora siamensis]|uniref:Uncharacterized protein n=1 Tax=Planobispora siamensis TaxID=936338 RepID=A0A8J3SGD1_9ACTN|nr:hypothetical protein [Planobispora siamensis]GIH93847.1 hypothetical protein Psi01_44770 [Planobispora siamensis]
MRCPPGATLAWIGHPVTVIATFVLLINDHLLKHLWPGLVTGKLSDLAGLMVAPPLLALARVPALAAVIATGLGFTLVKTTQAGAEAASQAWTLLAGPSRVLADPTDLITLPALAAAWLIWRRCQSEQAVRRARTLIIVPIALIAVTATAAVPPPPDATTVVSDGEAITVFDGHGADYGPITSRDDGRTWVRQPAPAPGPGSSPGSSPGPSAPAARTPDAGPASTSPARPVSPVPESCVPGEPGHCYRVVRGRLAVQESRDDGGSWKIAWEVPEDREEILRRVWDGTSWKQWGSVAVAVHATPDGHVVVVANGSDGIAVRDADGAWRRLGFSADGRSLSTEAAIPLNGADPDLTWEYAMGLFAGLIVFLAGIAVARRRHAPGHGYAAAAYTLASVGLLIAITLDGDLFSPITTMAALTFAVVSVAFAIVAARPARMRAWAWSCVLTASAGTTLAIWALFLGWVSGTPGGYGTAVAFSCSATVIGLAGSALAGWEGRRGPVRGDRP